jgi:hypothetical protein
MSFATSAATRFSRSPHTDRLLIHADLEKFSVEAKLTVGRGKTGFTTGHGPMKWLSADAALASESNECSSGESRASRYLPALKPALESLVVRRPEGSPMKTNGLVFRGALALPLLFNSICPAAELVELPTIEQSLIAATELDSTPSPSVLSDSSVAPVQFLGDIVAEDRNPFCYASAEMLFLDINGDTGGRITASFDDSGTGGTEISFRTGTGVQDEFGVGSRIVVGRQFSEKWGIAGRYFHFENTETGFPRLTPGTTPLPTFGTYTETDTLKMYAIDLEAVRSFNPGKTKIDYSFGGRQASLDVDSLFHAFGVITTGNFTNLNLSNGCAFDGAGITSSLSVRRQIGDSCAYLFGSARGSKMWNHSDSFGRSAGVVVSNPSTPLSGAATVTRNNADADLVTWEASTGIQFEFALRNLPATAFCRVAAEYQDWDINGPPTGGAGFGGTIGTLTTNSFSSAGLGDTELVGGALAVGFTY